MYERLADHLRHFKTIDAHDMELMHRYFEPVSFSKGDFLVKEHENSEQVMFVTEGYFHVFVRKEIEEKTVHISGPGDFVSALSSFLSREKSYENVRAITDAKALSISYDNLQSLYGASKGWEKLGRIVMENLFVAKQKRVISFIKDSSEKRYDNLMKENVDFLQHIPLKILASYLGIKPETLSRIRAKIAS